MSAEPTRPISPTRFRAALTHLDLPTLHAKAAEIQNSIAHLKSSNDQMLPFAEEGDADCREAMFENLGVIGRMNERVGMIRGEVEARGMPWTAEGEGDGEVDGVGPNGNGIGVRGGRVDTDGDGIVMGGPGSELLNGVGGRTAAGPESTVNSAAVGEVPAPRAPSGRLTDEELRRQLEAQTRDGGDGEGEEGVHL